MSNRIKAGFLLMIAIIITFLSYKIIIKARLKQQAKENTHLLPDFEFQTLDGNLFTKSKLKKDAPVVFILFNTECGYCQYEVEEIQKNARLLEKIQILMISEESPELVSSFSDKNKLAEVSGLKVLTDSKQEFLKTFGINAVPVVFIYDRTHKLVKQYNGETKIEAIVKAAWNRI